MEILTANTIHTFKIQGVETAMVRIPGASHHLTTKPSNLIAKVSAILAWFDKYKTD